MTTNFQVARRFSGKSKLVIEFEVKAKNLHGTDYAGNIGRIHPVNPNSEEWIRKKNPRSFRPFLSKTMMQAVEPQALLLGLVKPSQIKGIWYNDQWHSRKEFLDLGLRLYQRDGKGKVLSDIGYDMSYPGYSLDQFYEIVSGLAGRDVGTVKSTLDRINRLPPDRREKSLHHLLEILGFGPTAIRSYDEKLRESIMSPE